LTRIAVIVATLGRPEDVGRLLEQVALQTLQPTIVVLSVESESDLPEGLADSVQVVMGPRGLPAQRNRGMIPVLGDCDLVVFFDDDYLPCAQALEGMAALFDRYPDVVGATGLVLADGVGVGGIDLDAALEIVRAFEAGLRAQSLAEPSLAAPSPLAPRIDRDLSGLYGCNMVFRTSAIGDARFDENLPLYGWQEDIDFAARLLPKGRLVKTDAFAGVHRGVTRGRTSGLRFGFSQIVNPIYMVRKGTMRPKEAATLVARNVIANHVKALWPEPWVDRWGRVRGNWIAIADLLAGRIDPRRILDLH
jgi:GT2 family glycosyltransferase